MEYDDLGGDDWGVPMDMTLRYSDPRKRQRTLWAHSRCDIVLRCQFKSGNQYISRAKAAVWIRTNTRHFPPPWLLPLFDTLRMYQAKRRELWKQWLWWASRSSLAIMIYANLPIFQRTNIHCQWRQNFSCACWEVGLKRNPNLTQTRAESAANWLERNPSEILWKKEIEQR